ncbi:hypothetical protein SRABI96_05238 [Peribacillus sp. Bi96]|nr:hypothetical protein SRABI96_05238 [Peribacillus sp. Bi96]
MFHLFAAFAEFERNLNEEHTAVNLRKVQYEEKAKKRDSNMLSFFHHLQIQVQPNPFTHTLLQRGTHCPCSQCPPP